jgi:site-specific recombinase XerD
MPPALVMSVEDETLVAEYVASLTAAGLSTIVAKLWPAKAFCARVGRPQDWSELTIDKQCALHHRVRTFVGWLMVTGRLAATADYLVVGRPQLGRTAALHYPSLHHQLTSTASELGYCHGVAEDQWSLLVRAGAMFCLPPHEVGISLLRQACQALRDAEARHHPDRPRRESVTKPAHGLEAVLFHAGLVDQAPEHRAAWDRRSQADAEWAVVPARMAKTMHTYLEQCSLTQRPATAKRNEAALRELGVFLVGYDPELTCVADIRRPHLEAYKSWLARRPVKGHGKGPTLGRASVKNRLIATGLFFERLIEWGADDAPGTRLLYSGDLPIVDAPFPRFIDDAASAKLLQAARADDDPFVRLAIEMLARTGMRKSELVHLTVDAVVQIGSAYWLRIPIGKLHTDRYIPLHPQLKQLLDAWLADRPDVLRSDLLFVERGRPIGTSRVDHALAKVAQAAGIGHLAPHQLRHTLATQAINRGMSLEAIAALLGHKTLTMTLIYARIADRTVAEEYFAVSEKVEALYDQPRELSADAEGAEMRKLRSEMHRRMLGNGYCARPVEMDCHFESICESCSFFVTTVEFRPTLQRQRDDAELKGQIGRQHIFDGLLDRLDIEAS